MMYRKKISLFMVICIVFSLFAVNGGMVFADEGTKLVAWYTFDGSLKDSSGNGNNGSQVGNVTFVPGPVGQAAVFDGKSYIEVPDSDSLDLGKDFTFSAWIFSNPVNADGGRSASRQTILTKLNSDANNSIPSYSVEKQGMNPFLQRYDTGDIGSGGGGERADKKIEDHKWELLTITYDGSTIKFYQNGEILSTVDSPGGSPLTKSAGKLQIGMGDNCFFNGRLDDLRIYNKALAQQEVKKLYADAAAGPGKDLIKRPDRMIAYYSFNKDSKDYSGLNNNGTAVGKISLVNSIASKGAKFDGHSYIEVQDSDSIEVDKGFTASAWFKLDDPKQELYIQPVITKLESSYNLNDPAYTFAINAAYYDREKGAGYCPYFDFNGFYSEGGDGCKSDSALMPGSWAMLTMTYARDEIRFYYNGRLIHSENVNPDDIVHSAGKLVIGKLFNNGTTFFTKGIIDELRLYNYTLSAAEVNNLYKYRDSLVVKAPNSVTLNALKPKHAVQLSTYLSTYKFTASSEVPGTGRNDFDLQPLNSNVSYKSGSPKIVSVDSKGKLTPLAKGKAVITVTHGELSTSFNVAVN